MAIKVEWQDERGKTLARYGGPSLTADVIWKAAPSTVCLRFIDPYGDATFNQLQMGQLLDELKELGADPELIAFVDLAIGQVHTYLKFIGD
jgi:hypothetical protein